MAKAVDKTRKPPPDPTWHAVNVIAGSGACAAAVALGKQRFLSKDAPRLPLKECTSPDGCKCAYRHHKDRRSTPRRWSDQGGVNRQRNQGERRAKRGRRGED
jgi:hypothetical protein